MKPIRCETCIVGGGVTGTALAYVLSRFTNVQKVVLLEKYARVAQVNSHPLFNAQTSHDGSTETNYDLPHALKVKAAATVLRRYIDSKNDLTLSRKAKRMVLAVNDKEIRKLKKRFLEFKPYYPDLWLAHADELAKIEPNLMKGRTTSVLAMGSNEGYIVNYQRLAENFFEDTRQHNRHFQSFFNTAVRQMEDCSSHYRILTDDREVLADTVTFAAGPYSLWFARKLGYGLDYGLLSVAGSFYEAGHWLDNKVYRMQVEGRPFAEIHGDPDILDMGLTRFGPTTKPLPLMERYHYETFWDFMQLPVASTLRGIYSLFKILWKRKLAWYVLKNVLYDMPVIGQALFLREVQKIIPTLRYHDLRLRKKAGGIRPQIVNLKTGDLEMGDASLVGRHIIFNTTPSPGASVCLGNAYRDAKRMVGFLGEGYYFKEEEFQKELGEVTIRRNTA